MNRINISINVKFKYDIDLKLVHLPVQRVHTRNMILVLRKGDSSNAWNYFHRLNDLQWLIVLYLLALS